MSGWGKSNSPGSPIPATKKHQGFVAAIVDGGNIRVINLTYLTDLSGGVVGTGRDTPLL